MIMAMKKIYTKEYLLFLAIGFLPLIYKIFQILFLSSFENAIKIIGQMVFIEIIFKIFKETLINPLFKTLGKNDNSEENKDYYAKKLLLIYSIICALFTTAIFLSLDPIMEISQIPAEIFGLTKPFLQLMVVVNGISVIVQYLFACSVISKNNKSILIYFLTSCLAMLILDIVFIPHFTLGFGVNGMAISMLIVNVCQLLYFVATMPKTRNREEHLFDKKNYTKLCLLSFAESVIRNLTYYFVVLVLINALNNQDLYYISNEFIWAIMLVPTLAQNDYIKQKISQNNSGSLKPYFLNNILIIAFICLMIPVALLLFKHVFRFENYNDYFLTLLKLLPCYIVFIFDNVIESFFIAAGKMHHVFIQTFLTNIVVYMTSFTLYLCGIWRVSLDSIIIVFSAGMILSSLYTIAVYFYSSKHKKSTSF